MDRNSIIGFVLISILLIVYFIYNQDQVEKQQAIAQQEQARQDSLQAIEDSLYAIAVADSLASLPDEPAVALTPEVADSLRQVQLSQEFGPFAAATTGTDTLYTLENDRIKVVLSNKGGQLYSVELKGYKTFTGNPLVLFDGGNSLFSYGFPIGKSYVSTRDLYFMVSGASAAVSGDETATIRFTAVAANGASITQQYTLSGTSAFVDYSLQLEGFDDLLGRESNFILDWTTRLNLQEREYEKERAATTVYYQTADNLTVDYIGESTEARDEPVKVPLKWVSFKQQFFNSTIIAGNQPFLSGSMWTATPTEDEFLRELRTKLYLPYDGSANVNYDMQFYFGPNGYYNLKKLGHDMEDMVPLGGFMLGWINKFMILPVFDFLGRFTSNYGIIILLLAIFIKIILSPLTWKSFQSTAKMRLLKPEMEEIKAKYKDDMQKQQMETMKLYQKTGVSMTGGCLPMLLQMPILFAMYRFFPASIYLRQAEFLWAKDLSTYDSILDLGTKIPFYGDHVSLFTILMAATSILYSRMNANMTPSAGGAQMKMLMYIMPFFLIFIFNGLPAGLTYYYLLYNILSFGQQSLFQKFFINEDKLRKQMEERKKKPVKKSKWQQRLEDMQKLQEQQRRGKK